MSNLIRIKKKVHWSTKLNDEVRMLRIENGLLKESLKCANSEMCTMRTEYMAIVQVFVTII
jgi:hypothetical protein